MEVKQAHTEILLSLFNNILLLHIILFLFLWVIFAGFLFLMLNPLIKRVSKEVSRQSLPLAQYARPIKLRLAIQNLPV